MFDTLGTLYGACSRGDLLTKDGEIPNMEKAMLADAVATTCGAVCGTSTVTTFVESSAASAKAEEQAWLPWSQPRFFFIARFLSPVAVLIHPVLRPPL